MKPQTSETRGQILCRGGNSSSVLLSASKLKAQHLLSRACQDHCSCGILHCAWLPLDMYIFKFVARRSARAVTFPLPALIFTAHSQYCSLACLWLLNMANFITSIRKLNPKEQSDSTEHFSSGTEPALTRNFATPLGFRGWRDVTQSPFTHAFLAAKTFLPTSQLISEIDLKKHISVWTLVSEKRARTWPSQVAHFWNWEQQNMGKKCFLWWPGFWRVIDHSKNISLLNANVSYTAWQLPPFHHSTGLILY